VGHGGNMILNVPPNRKGLIDPLDSAALMEFKQIRDKAFANNLFKNAKLFYTDNSIEVHLSKPVNLNSVVIKEKISLGQRVVKFEISGGNDLKQFQPIAKGTTIGHKRIIQFPTQKVQYIRVKFTEYKAKPIISDISGYLISN
jgi:alpha-L-fucosidase